MADKPESLCLLEGAGLRSTAVRQGVLAMLLESGRSLSHRELVERLAGFDRITIFRSLKLLKKAGLLHAVQGIDGTLRYLVTPRSSVADAAAGGEAAGDHAQRADGPATPGLAARGGCPGGHPHFLCLDCGAMSCLADQDLPRIEVPEGTEVRGKQLLVYGLCPACAARSSGRSPGSACPEV